MNGEGSLLDLAAVMGVMNNARDNRDYGYDDGMGFGGYGIWFIMLIFMMAIFGGGFGGFGGWGGGAFGGAMNQLTNEFLYTNLNNSIQRGIDQATNQNFGLQKDLCQGFAGVQAAIAQNQYNNEKCCCEIKQEVMQNRYDAQRNTCDVITAIGQAKNDILGYLTTDKIEELRNNLNLSTTNSMIQQAVASAVAQIRPTPTPSYTVCSPYESVSNTLETLLLASLARGNGWFNNNNNNCGCNGWNYNFA